MPSMLYFTNSRQVKQKLNHLHLQPAEFAWRVVIKVSSIWVGGHVPLPQRTGTGTGVNVMSSTTAEADIGRIIQEIETGTGTTAATVTDTTILIGIGMDTETVIGIH